MCEQYVALAVFKYLGICDQRCGIWNASKFAILGMMLRHEGLVFPSIRPLYDFEISNSYNCWSLEFADACRYFKISTLAKYVDFCPAMPETVHQVGRAL